MVNKPTPTEAWGIAGFVLSVLSILFVFAPYFGLPLAIAAVAFSAKQQKIKHSGLATAALVIGIIGILINIIVLIFAVGMLAVLSFITGTSETVTVVDSTSPERIVEEPKTKIGTLVIDRVTVTATNLNQIRITVTNKGDVSFTPRFDVIVSDSQGKKVCEDSPFFNIGSVQAGENKTDEIQIFACMFKEDGIYTVNVNMLDEEYKKLSSAKKSVTVEYWNQFNFIIN